MNQEQLRIMSGKNGFIAALDQSGGSTPKALKNYGIGEDQYSNDEEMFNLVHEMRTRIITSPSFTSDHILAAILFPMDDITDFLYLIGSVFAPMIAIQIADVLLLRHDRSDAAFCLDNLLIWLAGFILYRLLMHTDFVLGNTLPDMVIVMLITLFVHKLRQAMTKKEAHRAS